jgi:hypothetical protein
MRPTVKNNLISAPIEKGMPWTVTIRTPELDLSVFSDIRADIKAEPSLQAPVLFHLSIGSGITRDTDHQITLSLSDAHTTNIRQVILYTDIKLFIGTEPYPPRIPIRIPVVDTVTNTPRN